MTLFKPSALITFLMRVHLRAVAVLLLLSVIPAAHAAVDVNQLVNESAPSIVRVQGIQWVKLKIPDQYKDVTDDPVYRSLSSVFIDNPNDDAVKATPVIKKRLTGSGFIISSTGRIATNYQWIKNTQEIQVILTNNRRYKARIVRVEPKNDLVILQIAASNLPAIGLAREVQEGEGVIAIGADKKGISVGVIVSTPAQTPALGLVSDVTVNRDNSGGPLLNIYGQVLGVNSTLTRAPMGLYRHPTISKLNSEAAAQTADSIGLLGSIGFNARTLRAKSSTASGADALSGATVTQVRNGSLAQQAGLQKGDIITMLESEYIHEAQDLRAIDTFLKQDNRAQLRVYRAGQWLDIALSKKSSASTTVNSAWTRLGLNVRNLTPAQKSAASIDAGVAVTQVQGVAQEAGLKAGDWIVSINQSPVESAQDLSRMAQNVEAGQPLVLYVIRQDLRQFITLTVGE